MRVLVYGGRDFAKQNLGFRALDQLHAEFGFTLVIDGMARGADTIGYNWAQKEELPSERYPAQWDKYGRSAGPIRNKQMLDEGKPDIAVAFPGGTGTSNMTKQLLEAGVLVKFVIPKGKTR